MARRCGRSRKPVGDAIQQFALRVYGGLEPADDLRQLRERSVQASEQVLRVGAPIGRGQPVRVTTFRRALVVLRLPKPKVRKQFADPSSWGSRRWSAPTAAIRLT